jgi:hypothetical protein
MNVADGGHVQATHDLLGRLDGIVRYEPVGLLTWRMKDAYFVLRKYFGIMSASKGLGLRTLQARPCGNLQYRCHFVERFSLNSSSLYKVHAVLHLPRNKLLVFWGRKDLMQF